MKFIITSIARGKKQTCAFEAAAEQGKRREMKLISVFPQMTYQSIHGFGGAFTDASGYVYSLMDQETRQEVIRTYFAPDGLGYTWGRAAIDSSDFGREMYAADDDPADEALEHMDYSRAERYVLPLLRDAEAAAGKPIQLMLTPWSPPAYMKDNQSRVRGGKLLPEYAERWAEYICRYVVHCRDIGLDVRLLSVQNEPHAVQRWDSCIMTDADETAFVRDHLGPALRRHGLSQAVTLLIWDHNKEHLLERAQHVLADPAAAAYVGGMAFHWYSGDHFDSVRMTAERFPHRRLVFSEGCVEHSVFGADAELAGAVHYAHELIGDINAGADTFLDWNLLLDAQGGPNHAANYCDAPMMYDTEAKVLHKRLSLDYIGHFSRYIRPGAVRLGVSSFSPDVEAVVVRNPGGGIAAVLLNTTDKALECWLHIGDADCRLELPPYGIASGIME